MASKLGNLQSALNATRAGPATPAAAANGARQPAIEPTLTALPRQANRQGKVNLAAWLHPDFKSSLRLIQARRPGSSIQDLMEEAFNDLFAKYDVPQVRLDKSGT